MKKTRGILVLFVLCAAVLLTAAGLKMTPAAYADQYHTGNAEIRENIRKLEIDWTSGAVHFTYHSGDAIIISETADSAVEADQRMRWRVSGDTLRIESKHQDGLLFSFLSPDKELTVSLPERLTLEKAEITSASASLRIPALRAETLKLETVSGDIRATVNARSVKGKTISGDMLIRVMNEAEEISLEATSGDVTLESAGAKKRTAIHTVSGKIQAALEKTGEFTARSTSGDIHAVLGWGNKIKLSSTSGDIIVDLADMGDLDVHTTSGKVTAFLPMTPGFTARVETTSGRVAHPLPLISEGKAYIAGDGSRPVKIHTTTGDITLNAHQ